MTDLQITLKWKSYRDKVEGAFLLRNDPAGFRKRMNQMQELIAKIKHTEKLSLREAIVLAAKRHPDSTWKIQVMAAGYEMAQAEGLANG